MLCRQPKLLLAPSGPFQDRRIRLLHFVLVQALKSIRVPWSFSQAGPAPRRAGRLWFPCSLNSSPSPFVPQPLPCRHPRPLDDLGPLPVAPWPQQNSPHAHVTVPRRHIFSKRGASGPLPIKPVPERILLMREGDRRESVPRFCFDHLNEV